MNQITKTKDYNIFNTVRGNREIVKSHLLSLTKSIMTKNMLDTNPILVNEKMQIIDGQHRLEVAKANKLDIYYMVVDAADLADVQRLNSVKLAWRGYDYLNSYAALGIEDYVVLKHYVDKYKITLSNAIGIFSNAAFGQHALFKSGKWKMADEKKGEEFLLGYILFRPVVPSRVFNDREFTRALKKLFVTISAEEMIARIEEIATTIEYTTTVKDYLRQFETILNYRKTSNFIRLF